MKMRGGQVLKSDMPEYEIEDTFKVECIREISVVVNGRRYFVIFGTHTDGGFCAIPSVRDAVACELSSHMWFSDIDYNAAVIGHALKNHNAGLAIAKAIAVVARQESVTLKEKLVNKH